MFPVSSYVTSVRAMAGVYRLYYQSRRVGGAVIIENDALSCRSATRPAGSKRFRARSRSSRRPLIRAETKDIVHHFRGRLRSDPNGDDDCDSAGNTGNRSAATGKNGTRQALPSPNSDFYQLSDVLTADEKTIVQRVGRYRDEGPAGNQQVLVRRCVSVRAAAFRRAVAKRRSAAAPGRSSPVGLVHEKSRKNPPVAVSRIDLNRRIAKVRTSSRSSVSPRTSPQRRDT